VKSGLDGGHAAAILEKATIIETYISLPTRYASGSANRLALPPAAAVLIVTICSCTKRRK
jgi:hypothetical protein